MNRSEDAEEVLLALGSPLPLWQVTTPSYMVYSSMDTDPPECWSDVVDVEAATMADARVLAVKIMRQEPRRYRYISEYSHACPYSQLHVMMITG